MKTDKEMTESLLKRRDEYIREKSERSAALRLIPKIGVPVCAALALVTVLTLNGSIFKERGVDINLTANSDGIFPNGEGVSLTYAASAEPVVTDENRKIEFYNEISFSAKDLLNGNYDKSCGIIAQRDVVFPAEIVFDKVIYHLSDYYIKGESLNNGVAENAVFIPDKNEVVTFETYDYENETSKFLSCTFFRIKDMEGYGALLLNDQLIICQRSRSARFSIGEYTYEASVFLTDFSRYEISGNLEEDRDYTLCGVTNRYTNEEESGVYVVIENNESGARWVCFGQEENLPDTHVLITDYCGKVIDWAEDILMYCEMVDNGAWDNYYNIISLQSIYEDPLTGFMYNNRLYVRNSDYTDKDNRHLQIGTVGTGENAFTVFRVNIPGNMLAVIENGTFVYFEPKSQDISYVKPLGYDDLIRVVDNINQNRFTIDDLSTFSCEVFCFDGLYTATYCYENLNGEDYLISATSYSLSFDRIDSLTLYAKEDSIDLFYENDRLAEFLGKNAIWITAVNDTEEE